MLNGVNGKSVLGKLIVSKDGKCVLEIFISECEALHGRISFGHAFIFKVLGPYHAIAEGNPVFSFTSSTSGIPIFEGDAASLDFTGHTRSKCLP